MSLATMQTTAIVYWAPSAPDGFGDWSYAAPKQIMGRVQVKSHRPPMGIDDSFTTDTIVYANQNVSKYGWLWVGLVADIPNADPQLIPAAMRIKDAAYSSTPDNRFTVYKAII